MFEQPGFQRARATFGAVGVLVFGALLLLPVAAVRAATAPAVIESVSPDRGPITGGQWVTLIGTGFVEGITTVDLDGVNLPARVVSPTELTFVTPPHAVGSVSLDVQVDELASSATLYFYDETGATTTSAPDATATTVPTPTLEADGRAAVPDDGPDAEPRRPVVTRYPPSYSKPPRLAATGAATELLASAGLAMVVVGGAAVVATRRRNPAG